MCGIAGILCREPSRRPLTEALAPMVAAIRHRGPDAEGLWADQSGVCALGHRRLSIIDLSDAATQPMSAPDLPGMLTYNGEIYNYLELRAELEREGDEFRTTSDTEVLLRALHRWGVDETLRRAAGMFAFAFWHPSDRTLWLARDRAGKKPLYVYTTASAIYFASEIKALRPVGLAASGVDTEAIGHYLTLGFLPAPLTPYADVREVPAAHSVRVDTTLRWEARRYWELPVVDERDLSLAEAADEIEERLDRAVRLRLRSDVPVGTFLSGGIDSGLITALAARHVSSPMRTFTVCFDGTDVDETALARSVAERYGTDHTEIRIETDLDELLPAVVDAYDEPFADPSALPTFAIARAASRELKVVLNGEGSDEILCGYRRHLAAKYYDRWRTPLALIPHAAVRACGRVLPRSRRFRSPYAFFQRVLRGIDGDAYRRYITWSSDGFDELEKRAMLRFTPAQSTPAHLAEGFTQLAGLAPFRHYLALDFLLGMADCLLVKLDIATMAHGLEARCPFLDHELVEWASSLTRRSVLPATTSKPILRHLAHRLLPADVVTAPKRGFEIPLVEWLEGPLAEQVRDLCLDPHGIVLELCEREPIERLVEGRDGLEPARRAGRLWILLMLSLWRSRLS